MVKGEPKNSIKRMQEHQRKIVYATLIGTGLGFTLLGTFGLFSPEVLMAILGLDKDTVNLLSGILCFTGIMDILIATAIFKGRNRV